MSEIKVKQIRVAVDTHKLGEKIARALTKQNIGTVWIGTAVDIALREYAENHQELQVKVN